MYFLPGLEALDRLDFASGFAVGDSDVLNRAFVATWLGLLCAPPPASRLCDRLAFPPPVSPNPWERLTDLRPRKGFWRLPNWVLPLFDRRPRRSPRSEPRVELSDREICNRWPLT
jgi:hypothetical protein